MASMRRSIHVLTLYYGLLQVIHIIVLAWGLLVYLQSRTIGFPAPPPPGGWGEQTTYFLLGNGILDAFIALAAFIYVFAYFREKDWRFRLGLVCTTASLCSGAFFVLGTWPSGVWLLYPLNYFGLLFVFSPIIALFLLLFSRRDQGAPV